MDLSNPLVKLAITTGVIFAAWKYGNGVVKTMALGAAGVIALNQVPFARDGAGVRLVA